MSVAARARAAAEQGGDSRAIHAQGLTDLIWSDSSSVEKVDQAIASLEDASRLGGPSAAVLADLAAAHLVRAERAGTPGSLFEAVEAADSALALEPRNAVARYNLALALDWLTLDGEAARAWRGLIAVDPGSDWANTARGRLDALSRPALPPRPGADAAEAELAAWAVREPQEARVFAMETLLRGWGEAVLRGDTLRAGNHLRAAAAIAGALKRRPGGDETVSEMVGAIGGLAGQAEAVRTLAAAHVDYARAQPDLLRRDTKKARPRLEAALSRSARSPALDRWAKYWYGVALFYEQDPASAAIFRELVARTDTARYPALAGRARWSVGTPLLRRGKFPESREVLAQAHRLFDRAGERENLGAIQWLEAEWKFLTAEDDAAFVTFHRALETLRPYRGSLWRSNLLSAVSQAATARGFPRAGTRLQDEGVAVASRVRAGVYAEALLARARALTAAGRFELAVRDVEASRPLFDSLPESYQRDWLYEDLRFTAAGVVVRSDPARALAGLDSVVRFFGSENVVVRLLPALVRRAEVNLGLGDADAAAADLDHAALLLDDMTGDIPSAAVRASMLAAGRGVFDRLVTLYARTGRTSEALATLERGRASFSHISPAGTPRAPAAGTLTARPGEAAVVYALIGDTLLAFTVVDTTVRLHRRVVDRERLLQSIARTWRALELRAPADSVHGDLARLYDELVRPVRARLRPGGQLVVVADDELAAVPFAALRDTAARPGGRYLVQDFPIRFASTLRDANRPRAPAPPVGIALFVADPAFEAGTSGLKRLPKTAAEARAIAMRYPGRVVLEGPAAHRKAVASALPRASLFHFAGHAVFDDQRLAQSYLALAPGLDGSGRFTAAEIEGLNLGNVRLVVLAACETQRSAGGRSSGFAGLSGAMLSAGARGVVGSLWRVNEDLTRPLMREFHAAYSASGDAADALRRAQLRLLESDDPHLRSPAAWAGFRYAGD